MVRGLWSVVVGGEWVIVVPVFFRHDQQLTFNNHRPKTTDYRLQITDYRQLIQLRFTMKPLFVLVLAFLMALLIGKLSGDDDVRAAARIAMGVMLLFTSIGHFRFAKGMAMMIPASVPFKKSLVYVTGIMEIIAAITLQLPATREVTSILLVVFFVALLPANIYAAMHRINYERGSADGPGLAYLWFRIPLQVLFIIWVLFSTGHI